MFEFYRKDGRKKIGTSTDSAPLGSVLMTSAPMSGTAGSAAEAQSAPPGFLFCNGASFSTTGVYQPLYAVISNTFGSGAGTFNVPDYRGVFPVGAGTGYTLGLSGAGGNSSHVHTVDTHNHQIADHYHPLGGGWSGHSHTYDHTHTMTNHSHNAPDIANQNGSLYAPNSDSAQWVNNILSSATVINPASGTHQHIIKGVADSQSVSMGSPGGGGAPGAPSGTTSGGPGYTAWSVVPLTSTTTSPASITAGSVTSIPQSISVNFMIRAS